MLSYMSVSSQDVSPIDAALLNTARYFAIILLCGIGLLLLVQFVYYSISASRVQQKNSIKLAIFTAITRANSAVTKEERDAVRISAGIQLFDRKGLSVLSQVYESLSHTNRQTLREIVLNMGGAVYISHQLNTAADDYLVEILRMVGVLDLVSLEARVVELMYEHRDNIDLQFQAFLTLAELGSEEKLAKVCMDESFVRSLSFRSLQQLLKAYTGNKTALYSELLESPDAYVVRICIRRAGIEGMRSLADKILPWLDSDNFNIVIDAVRSLGLLHYAPAAQKTAALLKHERWEVRSVAATALASISPVQYADTLADALQDREWQVRYNAAAALRGCENFEQIRQKVLATGDKYAIEMLDYMAHTAKMWRQDK